MNLGIRVCAILMSMVFSIPIIITNWYPNGVEDMLINQKLMEAHNQALPTDKYAAEGKEEMARSSVTIMGVCRNVAEELPSMLESVERLAGYFRVSQVIFVEGDSSDETLQILRQWALKSPHNRTVHSTTAIHLKETVGAFAGRPLPREGRIALARNLALKALDSITLKTKYVINVDLDIIGWNDYGIQDSFGRPSWDVMCANGITIYGAYRDIYSMRMNNLTTNHHIFDEDHLLYNISASQRIVNRKIIEVRCC